MDWTQIMVTAITVLVSSGLIQFLVNRSDKKKEDAKNSELNKLREEFKKGIQKNGDADIDRFNKQETAISNLAEEHKNDFFIFRDVIEQLKDNDAKITDSIEKMSEKQDIMADSLMGQAHDRILYVVNQIIERGAITNKEKATIKAMYEPYRKLGGNGDVKEAVDYVLTLKTITEEESRERKNRIRDKAYQDMRDAYENNN